MNDRNYALIDAIHRASNVPYASCKGCLIQKKYKDLIDSDKCTEFQFICWGVSGVLLAKHSHYYLDPNQQKIDNLPDQLKVDILNDILKSGDCKQTVANLVKSTMI